MSNLIIQLDALIPFFAGLWWTAASFGAIPFVPGNPIKNDEIRRIWIGRWGKFLGPFLVLFGLLQFSGFMNRPAKKALATNHSEVQPELLNKLNTYSYSMILPCTTDSGIEHLPDGTSVLLQRCSIRNNTMRFIIGTRVPKDKFAKMPDFDGFAKGFLQHLQDGKIVAKKFVKIPNGVGEDYVFSGKVTAGKPDEGRYQVLMGQGELIELLYFGNKESKSKLPEVNKFFATLQIKLRKTRNFWNSDLP